MATGEPLCAWGLDSDSERVRTGRGRSRVRGPTHAWQLHSPNEGGREGEGGRREGGRYQFHRTLLMDSQPHQMSNRDHHNVPGQG